MKYNNLWFNWDLIHCYCYFLFFLVEFFGGGGFFFYSQTQNLKCSDFLYILFIVTDIIIFYRLSQKSSSYLEIKYAYLLVLGCIINNLVLLKAIFNYAFQTGNVLNATRSYLIKECFYKSFLFPKWKSVYHNLIYGLTPLQWIYWNYIFNMYVFKEFKNNKKATEILKKISSIYSQHIVTDYQVQKWFSKFFLTRWT